jgi:hypothetical protein
VGRLPSGVCVVRHRRSAYLLTHLASWGFVVIASEDTDTGTGISH